MGAAVEIPKINHVGVAGAGAWGSALAQVAAMAGREVTLWANRVELAHEINTQHQNSRLLPGR
ncbi:MAG: glycerol-3-phosphate dehydrogenase, partial [Planctomycetota bacterium]